jgi:uncharacterized protein YggE
MKKLWLLPFLTLLAFPAHADKAVARMAHAVPPVSGGSCALQETVNLTVTYNFKAKSFTEAKQKFDEQIAKVNEFAKQQKVTKFDLQNQNYNIYSQPLSYHPDGTPDTYSYQVNGSSNYVMDNANAAFKFAEFLTGQKMQVGLNSNSYRNSPCP